MGVAHRQAGEAGVLVTSLNPMNVASLCNVEAEAALCGALMIPGGEKLIDAVADMLSADDFSEPVHGRIFATLVREHALGRSTSPVTLRPFFENDEDMTELGGPSYLFQLTSSGSALIGAKDFAEQILELSRRRRFVFGLHDLAGKASDCETSFEALAADGDAVIATLADPGENTTEVTAAQAVETLIQQFDQRVTGVTCGSIVDADRLMGPLRPKKLIIIGGRPGMGKTAKAISYGVGAAKRGHGVLFISLEMGADELAGRIAADMCHNTVDPVPYSAINERQVTTSQVRRVREAQEQLKSLPFQIVDRSSLKSSSLDTLIRRYKRRFKARDHKLELVIVDYLQLMRPDHKTNSPYEAVSEISRRLKESAKAHGVAVMALAQLNRAVEQREDKRPHLSDLKESGQIEQDADVVLFLYRAAYYAELAEPEQYSPEHGKWAEDYAIVRDKIEFIVAKRRDGKKGKATGFYFPEYQAMRGSDFYSAPAEDPRG